jgi:hypothetical protein
LQPSLSESKYAPHYVAPLPVREDLVPRAAGQYAASILQPKQGRAGAEASPPALPLTVSWLLRPDQSRSTLGKVLGEMKISTAKKQVLQPIAGAFPCNAVLHKWGVVARRPAHSAASLQRRRATFIVSVRPSRRPGSGPTTTWPRGCHGIFKVSNANSFNEF